MQGRSPTCYSPVRHSSTKASFGLSVRLACVKHAASVHPEPGSNSPQKHQTITAQCVFQKKQAVKSPIPNQNKPPNTKPCWTGYPKITFVSACCIRRGKTNKQHSFKKTTRETITRMKLCSFSPAHHKPQSLVQGHDDRHTPTTPHTTGQQAPTTNTPHNAMLTNKNALAHYRVLKQHTHTPPTRSFDLPAKAAYTTLLMESIQVNSSLFEFLPLCRPPSFASLCFAPWRREETIARCG